MHLPGSGPDAPSPAGISGGSRKQTVLQQPRTSSRRQLHGARRGQTLVEFTLILPVALLLTVGIIDTARLFAADISLTNGVREAALFAGGGGWDKWCSGVGGDVPCPPSSLGHTSLVGSIGSHIQVEAAGLDPTQILMPAPVCDDDAAVACSVTSLKVRIAATYPFHPLTPIIGAIMGDPIQIGATTTAVIQK